METKYQATVIGAKGKTVIYLCKRHMAAYQTNSARGGYAVIPRGYTGERECAECKRRTVKTPDK